MHYNEAIPPSGKQNDWLVVTVFMLSLLLALFELVYFSPPADDSSVLFADALDLIDPATAQSEEPDTLEAP